MHPWLLADIRKDDLAARYKRAEQSRLAAELRKNPTPAGVYAKALGEEFIDAQVTAWELADLPGCSTNFHSNLKKA